MTVTELIFIEVIELASMRVKLESVKFVLEKIKLSVDLHRNSPDADEKEL